LSCMVRVLIETVVLKQHQFFLSWNFGESITYTTGNEIWANISSPSRNYSWQVPRNSRCDPETFFDERGLGELASVIQWVTRDLKAHKIRKSLQMIPVHVFYVQRSPFEFFTQSSRDLWQTYKVIDPTNHGVSCCMATSDRKKECLIDNIVYFKPRKTSPVIRRQDDSLSLPRTFSACERTIGSHLYIVHSTKLVCPKRLIWG
jgi:hypothetical protein